jgi:adenosylcobinamide-phosphate guanylyltransferase
MCGGRGTRLASETEKPLVPIADEPMVDRVLRALRESAIEEAYAVVSPAAPETSAHVDCPTIRTPGEGYVADLQRALADERITPPVLTAAADLPLLDGSAVDAVRSRARDTLTVVVPVGRKRGLGVSVDTQFRDGAVAVAPAGINVVGEGEGETWRTRDVRVAVNVNRRADVRTCRWLLSDREDVTKPLSGNEGE